MRSLVFGLVISIGLYFYQRNVSIIVMKKSEIKK